MVATDNTTHRPIRRYSREFVIREDLPQPSTLKHSPRLRLHLLRRKGKPSSQTRSLRVVAGYGGRRDLPGHPPRKMPCSQERDDRDMSNSYSGTNSMNQSLILLE